MHSPLSTSPEQCTARTCLSLQVSLYEETFNLRFGGVEVLKYERLGWGDEDMLQLAQVRVAQSEA